MDAMAELLRWHVVADGDLPDADASVLLWIVFPAGDTDWTTGWLDFDGWHLCESGGICPWKVTHWAEPQGPQA